MCLHDSVWKVVQNTVKAQSIVTGKTSQGISLVTIWHESGIENRQEDTKTNARETAFLLRITFRSAPLLLSSLSPLSTFLVPSCYNKSLQRHLCRGNGQHRSLDHHAVFCIFVFLFFFLLTLISCFFFSLQLFASHCFSEGSSMSCSPFRDTLEWHMPQGGPCLVVGHSQPCPFGVSLFQYGSPIVTVSLGCACSTYDGWHHSEGNFLW